jgi:hypothetical protein
MDMIEQARYRIRHRQYEEQARQKRMDEYKAAYEKLEREEFLNSYPDAPNRYAKSLEIKTLKEELGAKMDEDFGMTDALNRLVDGDPE